MQPFRTNFIPECAAAIPPPELQWTFLSRERSAQDATTLSDQQ
jgi:hypothetical protein